MLNFWGVSATSTSTALHLEGPRPKVNISMGRPGSNLPVPKCGISVSFSVFCLGVLRGKKEGKFLTKKWLGYGGSTCFFGFIEVKSGEAVVVLGAVFFAGGKLGGCSDQSTGVSFSCSWR